MWSNFIATFNFTISFRKEHLVKSTLSLTLLSKKEKKVDITRKLKTKHHIYFSLWSVVGWKSQWYVQQRWCCSNWSVRKYFQPNVPGCLPTQTDLQVDYFSSPRTQSAAQFPHISTGNLSNPLRLYLWLR